MCKIVLVTFIHLLLIISMAYCTEDTPDLNWKFEYNDEGHITTVVDPGGKKTKISYEFDEQDHYLRQLIREHDDGTREIFGFDRSGRRVRMTDTDGTVRYTYDTADHLIRIDRDGYPSLLYTYDTMDRLKSMSVGKDLSVHYVYDYLGRLSRIETPAGAITYTYSTGQNMVIRTYPNGVQSIYEYLPNGNLGSITHANTNDKILSQFTYSFKPGGIIANITHWDPRWGGKKLDLGYDDVQRLISVSDASGQKTEYQYDKIGNRIATIINGERKGVSNYNWAGQLIDYDDKHCTHDAAGNLASSVNTHGTQHFTFNTMNQLKTTRMNDLLVEYQYDGDGYLIARIAGDKKTLFVPDPLTNAWCPLLAIDAEGKETLYIRDSEVTIAAITGKDARFFLHDHLGSVRAIVDRKGNVTDRYDYSSFGLSLQEIKGNNLQPGFAGLFFDPQINMYCTGARTYHPETGRFLQIDPDLRIPYGSQNDLSPYVYCGNDPVNYYDVTGEDRVAVNPELDDWENDLRKWQRQSQADMSRDFLRGLENDVYKTTGDILDKTFRDQDFARNLAHDYINDLRASRPGEPYHPERIFFDRFQQEFKSRIERELESAFKKYFAPKYSPVLRDIDIRNKVKNKFLDIAERNLKKYTGDLEIFKSLRNDPASYQYQDVLRDINTVFGRFEQTSHEMARVLSKESSRGLQNQMSHRGIVPFPTKSSQILGSVAGVYSSFLEGLQTGRKFIDITGRAIMASNMPVNLRHRRQWGWEGHTTRDFGGGKSFERHTALITRDLPGLRRGNITRWNIERMKDPYGTYERRSYSQTRASHFFERLMMHAYPVEHSYDPTDLRIESAKSHQKYRVITRGGYTTYIPEIPDAGMNAKSDSHAMPKMLIDIPGVEWKGAARENDWGAMLNNKMTIYIRHQGPGKDDWASPKEHDAIIVTLPHEWDYQSANEKLLPHIQSAFSHGRDVHVVVDMNLTFLRHVLPGGKKSENQWAADVADYVSGHKPAEYTGILVAHSRGTGSNEFMDFSKYKTVIISSPRGDDALRWINKTKDLPQTYIITGLSDAPAFRWQERLGNLVQNDNVHILQLQTLSDPATTHSRLQNVETDGNWKVISKVGESNFTGKLRELLSRPFYGESHLKKDAFGGYRRRNEYGPPDDILFWGGRDDGGGPGPGGDLLRRIGHGGPGGFSPMTPSNVGGVYLSGAGKVLETLGSLKGVAIDEKKGGLVLISQGENKIALPPLRMDDVVTVFRSVYQHGEAPFVSIDPNPEDPEGPIMFVRHGKATENTYVGWILFESDRVMKAYSLGHDNVTREKIQSKIPEYQNILELGFSNLDKTQKDPIWERFWIVPSEIRGTQTATQQLTLFDVPLKVNTQRMVLHQGKLEPAKDKEPSKPAKGFSQWFTRSYHLLEKEHRSEPPEGSGMNKPVECFAELRRIAVITAIAERLRDQGVPFPSWMRDYQVKPCKIPPTTPSMVVEATETKTTRTVKGDTIETNEETLNQKIYGGVNLAPADKDVHIVKEKNSGKGNEGLNAFASEIMGKIEKAPLLSPVSLVKKGQPYKALVLPGNDTRDVGAKRLMEPDLIVPVLRGTEISLVRQYNSFFKPDGVFGASWTLDLPYLEEQQIPVQRTGEEAKYTVAYQLTSPLNTYSECFRKQEHVKEVNGRLLVPERTKAFLGIADMEHKKIGFPTKALLFRDGVEWHFNDHGNLVAQIQATLTVIYRRDNAQNIRRIEGWYGKDLCADITIEYNEQGRILSATGSNKEKIAYEYDKTGCLQKVISSDDTIEYRYKDGLVTAILWNGDEIQQFEYDAQGRLISERQFESRVTYEVNPGENGIKVVSAAEGTSQSVEYDDTLRPLKQELADGTKVEWDYRDPKMTKITTSLPNGERYNTEMTSDGKQVTVSFPGGNTYTTKYDNAGRPVSFLQGDRQLIQQKWHPNGLMGSTIQEAVAVHPEYNDDKVVTGALITPPGEGSSYKDWTHIAYNVLGLPKEITDSSGAKVEVGYDKEGNVAVLNTQQGGIQLERDSAGNVKRTKNSWGYQQENTYDTESGELEQINLTHGNSTAQMHFDQGKLVNTRHFDGSETKIAYYDDGQHTDQLKEIKTPNELAMAYQYDDENRLSSVNCDGEYEVKYAYDDHGRLISLARVPVKK